MENARIDVRAFHFPDVYSAAPSARAGTHRRWRRGELVGRYGPLFFVVFFYNTCVIPLFNWSAGKCGATTSKQVWFFKFTGFVLWFLAFLWILPVAVLALVHDVEQHLRTAHKA